MTTEVNVYTDAFPYPDNPALRAAFRFPVLLYRMGFFNLIEKKIMLLSTYGRRSGKPRPIAIEYNKLDGRKFVIAAYGEKADWVQNMLADPHITLQSMDGIESVIGRRVVSDDELSQAYQVFEQNPFFPFQVRLGKGVTRDLFRFSELYHQRRAHENVQRNLVYGFSVTEKVEGGIYVGAGVSTH